MCKLGIELQCTLIAIFKTVFDLTWKNSWFLRTIFNCQNKIFFNEFQNKMLNEHSFTTEPHAQYV